MMMSASAPGPHEGSGRAFAFIETLGRERVGGAGGAFAEGFPGAGGDDGFFVYVHPGADAFEGFDLPVVDGAVVADGDVEEEVAGFADDVAHLDDVD